MPILVILVILWRQMAYADLPPDAAQLLQTLPQKAITLDFVLATALEKSESYQAIKAGEITTSVPIQLAESALDPTLTLKGVFLDDKREPSNGFAPNKLGATKFSIGLSKYFSTGTLLSTEVSNGSHFINFPAFPAPFNYAEGIASINFTQNLWKDFFGLGTRKKIRAAEKKKIASESEVTETKNQWQLQLTQAYYQAWLSQALSQAAFDNVARRQRLLKITQLKTQRGTAEKPDLLQVESAKLNSEVQLENAKQNLANAWRALAVILKAPDNWLSIDPMDIPMRLDDPFTEIESACGTPDKLNQAPENTVTTLKYQELAAAAQLEKEAANNAKAPTLQLNFGLTANGVESTRGSSLEEAFRITHPAWTVGMTLQVPLSNDADNATSSLATANSIRSDALLTQSRDQLRIQWIKACTNFQRLQNAYLKLDTAFKNQNLRADLEEKRFSLGRAPTIAVIQAGDDATLALTALKQGEIERRLAAWEVKQLAGALESFRQKLMEDHTH